MRKIQKNSIQFKLIVSFLFLVLTTVTLFTVYSYISGSRSVKNEIHKRGIDVTRVFTQMTTPLLFSMDYIAILNNAKELVGKNDILSVMVMDKKGNTIVDTDSVSSSTVNIGEFYQQVINNKTMEYRQLSVSGKNVLEFISPVVIFEKVEGIVRIRISLKAMNKRLVQHTLNIIFIATGMIILAFLLAMLLSKLFNPLAVLLDGTNQIINGNLEFGIPDFSNDEIGELARSFDLMRQHLKSGFLKLEKQKDTILALNEGLEHRVEKRTSQLSKANRQLLQEISEKEMVEDKLRRLRNYLGNIIDSMPSILVGLDDKGRVTQWNREAQNLTGIRSSDAEGKLLDDIIPDLPVNYDLIRETAKQRDVKKLSMVAMNINGEQHYFDVTLYPLEDQNAGGVVVRVDDVTEKKRVSEILAQSEKMLSVGGLAIGMAHEINNPLAGILQNIQVLGNRIKGDLPANLRIAEEIGISIRDVEAYMKGRGLFKTIEAIQVSGSRVAKIVENLSYFSRECCPEKKKKNITSLIDRSLELVSGEYKPENLYYFNDIKIIRKYEEETLEVACESSMIEQVIISIVKNGAQAMAEERKKVGTGKIPHFIIRVIRETEMCRIEIEDNGPGMDESVYKRVFDPFFTTKSVDAGPGLGLSVAYFIVTESHGGTMSVDAWPGKGTKFVIRLPSDYWINPKVA